MRKVKFELELWCDDIDLGGFEFVNELMVPIDPYIGMEIYHTGYDLYVDYLAIEYDKEDKPSVLCVLKTMEDANIHIARGLYKNGWKLNCDYYGPNKDRLFEAKDLLETSDYPKSISG